MPLIDFCKAPVYTIAPDKFAIEAAELMRDKKIGCLVVTEFEKPIGILTDRDLMIRVLAEGKDPSTTKIRDIMTSEPVMVPETVGVWELVQTMKKHGVRRFPVLAGDGKLVGMITLDDLIELIGDEMSGLGEAIASELGHTKPAEVKV